MIELLHNPMVGAEMVCLTVTTHFVGLVILMRMLRTEDITFTPTRALLAKPGSSSLSFSVL